MLDLVIENTGVEVYQPAQLAVTATSNGNAALQVIDSTQGYTGSVSTPTDELPPGQHLLIGSAQRASGGATEMAHAREGSGQSHSDRCCRQ